MTFAAAYLYWNSIMSLPFHFVLSKSAVRYQLTLLALPRLVYLYQARCPTSRLQLVVLQVRTSQIGPTFVFHLSRHLSLFPLRSDNQKTV
jgi:hypothetical protein